MVPGPTARGDGFTTYFQVCELICSAMTQGYLAASFLPAIVQ